MNDTGYEGQDNMRVDTSLTINQFPDVIDPKVHAPKKRRKGTIRLQVSSSLETRLPGTREACKGSEEGELGFPDTGDGERDRSRPQPKRTKGS